MMGWARARKGKDGFTLARSCLQEASGQRCGKGHDHFVSGSSLFNQRAAHLALGGPFWKKNLSRASC